MYKFTDKFSVKKKKKNLKWAEFSFHMLILKLASLKFETLLSQLKEGREFSKW